MNIWGLAALVLQYFIPGLFSMLFRVYGLGTRSRRSAVIGLAVFTAVSLVLPSFLIVLMGYDNYKHYAAIFMFLANFSVFIISSDGFLKTCFLHLSQQCVIFWISFAAASLRRMFELSYPVSDLIRLTLCAAALTLGLRLWRKPLRFMADTIRTGWLGLLAVPGCLLLSSLAISLWFGLQPSYPEILMTFVMTLLLVSFLAYMSGLYHSLKESAELYRQRSRQTLLEAELAAVDDSLSAARRTRHDLRHHNAVLLEYLHCGETERAVKYLEEVDENIAATAIRQFCQNPTADAVLRIYDRKTRAEGISFAVQADIPKELPLAGMELGAMLGNLLENASEACAKLQCADRFISLMAEADGYGWKMEMRNSVSGTVEFDNGLPRSTKTVGGTGTRSVAATVEKYRGIFRFYQEGGEFITQIFLPLLRESMSRHDL